MHDVLCVRIAVAVHFVLAETVEGVSQPDSNVLTSVTMLTLDINRERIT